MKRKLFNLLKICILLIVFYFIIIFFIDNLNELNAFELHINFSYLILSNALFFIYVFISVLIWHFITIKVNCAISFKEAIVAWFYSLLGKYIPGKVLPLAARAYYYKQAGVSYKKITFCLFLESILHLLSLLFVVLFSLFFMKINGLEKYKLILLFTTAVSFVVIHPKILGIIINLVMKILKKDSIKLPLTYKSILEMLLLYILAWFIFGLSFFFLANSIYRVPTNYIFHIIGSFSLASLIGIISLFAPSGVGIREGVLILMLKHILPNSITVIISIFARVWSTSLELLVIFLVFVFAKIKKVQFHAPFMKLKTSNLENENINKRRCRIQ